MENHFQIIILQKSIVNNLHTNFLRIENIPKLLFNSIVYFRTHLQALYTNEQFRFFPSEISSQVRGRVGLLPLHEPITIFRYFHAPEFENFLKMTREGVFPFYEDSYLVARGDLVFGWKDGDQIRPIIDENSSFIMHNLETHETFHRQPFERIRRMGVFGPMPPNPAYHHRFVGQQRTYAGRLGID